MKLLSSYRHHQSIIIGVAICLIFISNSVFAQQKNYTVANAHAHNDYMHPVPFYTAFNAGFGSIEADIYPVHDVLYVAHNKNDIKQDRTLKSLYIDPLLRELAKNKYRHLKLLIDVKEDYKSSLQILLKEIEPLKKYLATPGKMRNLVTILISGERPPPSEYKNYPDYIFFDDDLTLKHNPGEWKRVGQVSLSFERYSSWRGKGSLETSDEKLLQHTIDSVHNAGKTVRFWAAPDTELSWETQMKLGADLIGTDEIDELADFLNSKRKK
ncbi:MAG: alkaline phosphatase [Ginsengibacter sp.]